MSGTDVAELERRVEKLERCLEEAYTTVEALVSKFELCATSHTELQDQVSTQARAIAELAGPEIADDGVVAHARWAASMQAGGAAG